MNPSLDQNAAVRDGGTNGMKHDLSPYPLLIDWSCVWQRQRRV